MEDPYSYIEEDPVVPVSIEHRCEEIRFNGELEMSYNFIVYHFECDGAYVWAKAYLYKIGTVSVYGPFENRSSLETGELKETGGKLNEAILDYLRRRFRSIEASQDRGYVQIWP